MNSVQTWGEALVFSLTDLWGKFIGFIPSFIGALFVFLAGLVVAVFVAKVAEKLISVLKVDQLFDKMIDGKIKESGFEFHAAKFFGGIVKWFFILVFLMAATDILKLNEVTSFLKNIVLYIPNIIVVVIILSITFILANFVFNAVRSSTKVAGVTKATVIASIAKWSIVVFGFLASLIQLGIAASLVNTIFIGFVAALSLALGLSFGLGGKDEAALILRKLREDFENK